MSSSLPPSGPHKQINSNSVQILPAGQLRGDFRLPGDKSISHRSAIFAALGDGPSVITGYSSARDCANTLDCLSALGIKIDASSERILIEGAGVDGLRAPTRALDVGNSGTTIRILSGVLAGQPFTSVIGGDESISRRPMRRIIEPLTRMGAEIEAREGNFAPLRIRGGELSAIEYAPPVASAQVKTCTLLAGLFARGTTTVVESTPTRNHTEIMLRECGVRLAIEQSAGADRISVEGGQRLRPLGEYTVAGDISSAAFFLVAALLVPSSEVRLRHIGINPSRRALIDLLDQMGGDVSIENERTAHGEPVADLVARSSSLAGEIELSGAIIANLIDEIPILAIAGTQIDGSLTVRDARELRVKESDRIRSIVENLRRMGATVEEFEDGFQLRGRQQLEGARIDSFGDHRIAMAFSVAGLIASGGTRIDGADAASVSLPEFYSLLSDAGARIESLEG